MTSVLNEKLSPGSIEPLTGPARIVRDRLKGSDDSQVVAFRLESLSKDEASAFANAVRLIAPMIFDKIVLSKTATLEKLVDALVPGVSPPEHLLTEARMNADARTAVLESAEWLDAGQLSEIAGFTGQNASAQPNKWKREGKIFALRYGVSDFYPGYALDPETQYRPVKGLAPILKVFGDRLDPWDIAIWFASANGFLGGVAPKDLLITDPERVLKAAEDEVAGVLHG